MLYVVVADNKTVRVLRGGEDQPLAELIVFYNAEALPHERDLIADRPGRTASSAGKARQAYEPRVSAKRIALERWLKLVGAQLQSLLAAQRADALVLVAAPRLLAQLRDSLPAKVRASIQAELPRDLAKQSPSQLAARLKPLLRKSRVEPLAQPRQLMRPARGRASAAL